jgi:uncharacterized protein YebE (UPF0316 family)
MNMLEIILTIFIAFIYGIIDGMKIEEYLSR